MNLLKTALLAPLIALTALPKLANAHCPLCVGAVGSAAAAATFMGFNPAVIGVLIGAFGVVSGEWLVKYLPKKYVPFQNEMLVLVSFLVMVLAALPASTNALYVPVLWFGEPGSVFNSVHWINTMLIGGIAGGIAAIAGNTVHNHIRSKRGSLFPFQGIVATVLSVVITAGIVQVVVP